MNPTAASSLKKPVNFHTTSMVDLDLNLDNYSLKDLFQIFNITDRSLSEENMKNAKKIVLKMHPDKSRLDSKYFLFFSNAYKRLYGVYEYEQNATRNTHDFENKRKDTQDYGAEFDRSNRSKLDSFFAQNSHLKDGQGFNEWFNSRFSSQATDHGYGDWLKSNDGIMDLPSNVTQENLNTVFEQKKKEMRVIVREEVSDLFAPMFGGSSLEETSMTGGEGCSNNGAFFTDLRDAYSNTLIPVREDDFKQVKVFKDVGALQAHRDKMDVKPLAESEATRVLQQQRDRAQNAQSIHWKLMQEADRARQTQNSFWSSLKLLGM